MFLYRRQGPKKRPKSGTPRKGRNPQKGLPNSARELLPVIQPATKALAQMLAGRTAASGQLGHARAVLAQTERLVAERAHNRLNPTEREEFFEQVARLKLTLSDAESEAEFQAAEEQATSPPPVPVDHERLKAMALALTMPSDRPSPLAKESETDDRFESQENGRASMLKENPASSDAISSEDHQEHKSVDAEKSTASTNRIDASPGDPKQLRLPRESSDKLALQPGTPVNIDGTTRRRKPKLATSSRSKTSARSATKDDVKKIEDSKTSVDDGVDKLETAGAQRSQKLPKGWIIDDEGFVVPGPS